MLFDLYFIAVQYFVDCFTKQSSDTMSFEQLGLKHDLLKLYSQIQQNLRRQFEGDGNIKTQISAILLTRHMVRNCLSG